MRRFKRMLALLGASAMISTLVVSPAAGSITEPGLPLYLALGDSWAAGQGAANPATGGYVPRLHTMLIEDLDCVPARSKNAVDGCRQLNLVNLGREGTDVLPGVTAPIVAAEQLPIALPMLEARNHDANPRNDVEVVTLQVGGNDVSGPFLTACLFGGDCIGTLIAETTAFESDLRIVVSQLREAAGPDTPIVLGTYDSPVSYCYLAGAEALGALMLEGGGGVDGIHDVIRRVAADYDADVAEVYGRLGPGDFVGGDDCLHTTDSGHAKVAEAFRTALGF